MKRVLLITLVACLLLALLPACGGSWEKDCSFRPLCWAVGAPMPEASDFATALPEGVTVRYAQQYSFSSVGEYTLKLIVTDQKGREFEQAVSFTLVFDKTPPALVGVKDLVTYVGEGISYREGVSVSDNCDGEIVLQIDSSHVNLRQEGAYPVTYTAIDAAGNYAVASVTAYVYSEKIDTSRLYAMLDSIIAQHIPSGGTTEQKVRAVYRYVYDNIAYSATSDKSDWVRAAYDGLRTGVGDCFTYYALSKAFFERLGIENMGIERTPGLTDERHYWNLVNLGTKEAPAWYHFDATHLRGVQHSGCLLTDAQVDAYTRMRVDENGVGNYFYAYDKSAYPASATKILTPTPSLGF
ncbi:MAG: transglutaminase domain-containing protein [Clostridia bacterium]|nr:transglutaminase domain-containing protein [Clostridia bacterium]